MRDETATRQGRVRGSAGRPVVAFRGIPFARAPLGPLRLRPPERPEAWQGVIDATAFGAASLQSPPSHALGVPALSVGCQDEDCLSLNVWTPAIDGARRPVMVWIHGGGFEWGSSGQPLFDGSRLARRGDVVVVSFNYRLGALGFAHLAALAGRASTDANLGLLDQVAALTWVRENVGAFGGDPENVTLFGESAGAISIAALVTMPCAAGLFRRAILQSGGLQPLHDAEAAAAVVRDLLEELWLSPDETESLRHVPAASVLAAQRVVSGRLRASPQRLGWQPCVDGKVLPRDPAEAIRAGAARGLALLVGTNRDECRPLVALDPLLRPADEAALRSRVRALVPEVPDPERLVAAYRRGLGSGADDLVCLASALETDAHFRLPAIRLAESQARHERRTFMYRFDWPSPALGGALGACHGLELPFVFGNTDAPGLEALVGDGPEARALAEQVMDAWIAFARSGDPGHAALDAWPAYDAALRATMRLGRQCGVVHDPGGMERRALAGARGRAEPARRRGGVGTRTALQLVQPGPLRPPGSEPR